MMYNFFILYCILHFIKMCVCVCVCVYYEETMYLF